MLAALLPLVQLGGEAFWLNGGIDLGSFLELFSASSQWALLANSVILACGASMVALVIGVPYAVLCEKVHFRGRSFFRLAYLLPLLIPPYMQAISWGHLLAKNGPINNFLVEILGLGGSPVSIYSITGAVFILGLAYFPFVTLLTMSGLRSIDKQYEEMALSQRSSFHTLSRITLPLVLPHIIAGTIFVFIFSIIDFGVPDILRVKVYPIEIFVQFSAFYNERAAILLGLPLLAITIIMISLQVWVMRGRTYVNFSNGLNGSQANFHFRNKTLAPIFCATVIALAVIVPVGSLLKMAGPLASYQKGLAASWAQIGFSFTMAVVAATIMTVIAYVIAHAMVLSSPKKRTIAEYLTQLPFAIPPILLGLALIKIWNRPMTEWLYGSHLIIIIGYFAHFIPFTIRVVYASLQQLNPRFEEMGSILSPSKLRVTSFITVPMIRKGLLIGFFISFILAFSELGTTLLVIPPGMSTIPIKIYNFMHYGAESMVAALCLILLVMQLLFTFGLLSLSRWIKERTA